MCRGSWEDAHLHGARCVHVTASAVAPPIRGGCGGACPSEQVCALHALGGRASAARHLVWVTVWIAAAGGHSTKGGAVRRWPPAHAAAVARRWHAWHAGRRAAGLLAAAAAAGAGAAAAGASAHGRATGAGGRRRPAGRTGGGAAAAAHGHGGRWAATGCHEPLHDTGEFLPMLRVGFCKVWVLTGVVRGSPAASGPTLAAM